MKLKDRIKTYNFWVSLSSAIFLLLKVLGTQFGFRVDESLFSDLITSLCGILVILGIIVPPSIKLQNISTVTEESFDSKLSVTNKDSVDTNINTLQDIPQIENIITVEDIPQEESINEIIEVKEENIINNSDNQNETDENQNCDFTEEKFEKYQNVEDVHTLMIQVEKTLNNQRNLLKNNPEIYLELLNNQIDLMNNN